MKKNRAPLPRLKTGTALVDTHCHLDMNRYADPDEVIRSAARNGVTRIVTVGIDSVSSDAAAALARRHPGVFATVGLHPHNAGDATEETFAYLARLAQAPANKIVGYGEIGLDFARNYAPRQAQINTFHRQLEIAREIGLPIIIHDRDAHEETMEILNQHAPFKAGGVMHCFSGDTELARRVLDLGLYISIPGIVTFNRSETLQQVAREIPLDRMVLETDGPFLAPVPWRGKTNLPEYLLYTAQKIAELRGISLEEVAGQTSRNAEQLFNLDSTGVPA